MSTSPSGAVLEYPFDEYVVREYPFGEYAVKRGTAFAGTAGHSRA
jgi:hypothetical protein